MRQRLLQEVEQVTGGAPIGEEHVEQLRFTAQVAKETSRLFPTVGVARAAGRDTKIAGFRIRRNAPVLIAI